MVGRWITVKPLQRPLKTCGICCSEFSIENVEGNSDRPQRVSQVSSDMGGYLTEAEYRLCGQTLLRGRLTVLSSNSCARFGLAVSVRKSALSKLRHVPDLQGCRRSEARLTFDSYFS